MMPRFSLVKLLAVVVFAAACAASTEPRGPQLRPSLIRVADCDGPARSLDPAIAATLPPRSGLMRPDDQWADLALRVPGGFAGVMYVDNKPVLMLTDPSQAAAAKQALAPEFVGFDINGAEVRKVRWDFAQLVDWFNYLMIQTPLWRTATLTSGDKDEAINRIRYGVIDEAARERLLEALAGMDLPCDLIAVEIVKPAVALPGNP
jgi:hypothetical protein